MSRTAANCWIHPAIQERLYEEIMEAFGRDAADVEEEDLQRLPYLKAVVLERLRRHPPGHFVLPHAVSEDTELGGFRVPKQGSLNFMVADRVGSSRVEGSHGVQARAVPGQRRGGRGV
ncbi:hypothetical protein SAY86_019548 [Trapa natans]|uniref:Uncharacterized protein n=1 Tax=Trapa natans TaxID=22666 RepID=A0AAN7LNC5_TRANT|nr:hypothetical protein SAY86_019548 [Trapa natans]